MPIPNDHLRVKAAMENCDSLIGGIFADFGLDDLREVLDDDHNLGRTCEAARRMLMLFESLVTQETARGEDSGRTRRRVAVQLREQHRMHPAIATVIEECYCRCDHSGHIILQAGSRALRV